MDHQVRPRQSKAASIQAASIQPASIQPASIQPARSPVALDRQLTTDRRKALQGFALVGGAFVGGAFVGGCGDGGPDSSSTLDAPRTDVPLRILLAGTEEEAEAIRLAWSMSMEQGLQIETIDPQTDPLAAEIDSRMKVVDLAILPQRMIGALASTGTAVALNADLLQKLDADVGPQLPSVEEGLGYYGGSRLGMASGCKLFAVLSVEPDVICKTWADYDTWIKTFGGEAAEPLGEGWAAASYLNRCASSFSRGWLFNRNTMKPEIASDDYVASLEQLASTAKHYNNPSMTPGQIWNGIRLGALRGGIGFEAAPLESAATSETSAEDVEEFDVGAFDCPQQTETDRVWFPPQTPLVSLSIGCRQTDASKRFLGWMSGGERASVLWQQSELFSVTRDRPGSETARNESSYRRWLIRRLQTRQIVPSLVLPGALRYYQVLDDSVRRCIGGEQSATDALQEAFKRWEVITDQLGRDSQRIAWKRSQGFGS